jgi:hypothetical protein
MSLAQVRQLLAAISGGHVRDGDYVGYLVNHHGEQLVFIQHPGDEEAVLLHSDLGWKSESIQPDTFRIGVEGSGELSALARVPVAGNVILDREEALWLAACFEASSWLRNG